MTTMRRGQMAGVFCRKCGREMVWQPNDRTGHWFAECPVWFGLKGVLLSLFRYPRSYSEHDMKIGAEYTPERRFDAATGRRLP